MSPLMLKGLGALGLAIALALWTAGVYRAGGAGPRAELEALTIAAEAEAADDLENKERTDAENARRIADLNRELARLRKQPAYVAPAAPAGSGCPPAQVCFDRAEFERAYRKLVEGVRGVAAEGSQIAIDLDSARDWANDE